MTSSHTASAGLRWILLATAVAGAFGYVVQLLAPAFLSNSSYVSFSVTWSAVYLCVATMSGVQQEVSRAARPSTDHPPNTVLRRFTVGASIVVVGASIVLGLVLGATTVPINGFALALVLGIGLIGYLMTAVLGGVFYGLHLWRDAALLTVTDAALRVLLLGAALVLGLPPIWLACGIAFPFGLAFLLLWIVTRRRVVGRFALDVSLPALSRNIMSTVGAAACTGAMISGLPLIIGITAAQEPATSLGAIMLAITLSRAPIVVPVLALQSFLISAVFRDRKHDPSRRVLGVLGLAILVILALAALAAAAGPWLISVLSAGKYTIDAVTMAIILVSAGLVALLSITGAALVARRQHSRNILGWAIAAALTVVGLLMPWDFALRVNVALTVPALLGLIVHVAGLLHRSVGGVPGSRNALG
ncbi:hypothetical protein GCM10025768_10550 [Microbacterium pseudoresistens]|uniref:O-antigen/teichoic acid export membrane protein n=1 Tax=Microbacterium pseudoresistens TaxID=640634 RepID=A0A7Y9EVY4_9MICO|nr:hypothetical protein [Microbacterium pseudoresistens]NYD54958.1 O-antigen/teichoic acid export membrane protein [Microbacterium pseudoresistens]